MRLVRIKSAPLSNVHLFQHIYKKENAPSLTCGGVDARSNVEVAQGVSMVGNVSLDFMRGRLVGHQLSVSD